MERPALARRRHLRGAHLELNVETDSEGLLAYWKFDEGTGKTVNDYSGNGNTITSVNDMGWVSVSLPESKK